MRDLFTKDIGWKLFSLVLAAAIWLTVHRILNETNGVAPEVGGTTVTYDNLPITAVSATADVRDFHIAPNTVKVVVTGPASAMNTLQADQLHASVNIAGASLTHGLILPVEISLPSQVAVVSIYPEKVLVIIPVPPEKKP
jgi:YbbR domain-containing protein